MQSAVANMCLMKTSLPQEINKTAVNSIPRSEGYYSIFLSIFVWFLGGLLYVFFLSSLPYVEDAATLTEVEDDIPRNKTLKGKIRKMLKRCPLFWLVFEGNLHGLISCDFVDEIMRLLWIWGILYFIFTVGLFFLITKEILKDYGGGMDNSTVGNVGSY